MGKVVSELETLLELRAFARSRSSLFFPNLMATSMPSTAGGGQQQESWGPVDEKNGVHTDTVPDENRESFNDGHLNDEGSVTAGQDQGHDGGRQDGKGSSTKSGAAYSERHVKVN